jgi:hypothetical protein
MENVAMEDYTTNGHESCVNSRSLNRCIPTPRRLLIENIEFIAKDNA